MDQMMFLSSQRQNWNRLVLISLMLYGMTSGNNEAVVNNIEVLVNDMVSIHCYTNASIDIQWHFNSIFNIVFAGGRLWSPHKERLRTEDDNAGSHILIIPRVRGEDAGWYYCSEEETARQISSTHLTVLYSNPDCFSNMHPDGFIGPNTCNLQQENMIFNCVVSFTGTSPHLMWRSLNDNQTLNSSICEDKPNRRNCSLILKSDPIYDGSIFVCQTSSSIDPNFNCSTGVVKIQYFSSTNDTAKKYVNDKVNCSTTGNLNVKYKWTLTQNNKVAFLSSNQNLVIQKPGIYQCEVEYSIRNNSCLSLASFLNVSVESTNVGTISGIATVAIVLPVVLVFVVFSAGIIIWIRKRRQRHERRECERRENERREYERRENERRECERKENERKENERRECERRENERRECERKENERRECERKENERIRNKIEEMYKDFVVEVNPRCVLEPLIQKHVISNTVSENVLNKETKEDRCRALLDHLFSSPHREAFIVLKKALISDYPSIVERIDANDTTDNSFIIRIPENERIKDKVVSMYIDFTSMVDPKNIIFDLLIQSRIISVEKKQMVMDKDTAKERCRALVDHLFFDNKSNGFIILREVLKECYPEIVERIDASYADNEAEDMTLADKEENERIRNRMVDIYEDFVSEVDPEKVLDFLIQNKIVNIKQKHYLKNQATTEEQCKALIDLLVSCSNENAFITLKEALKEHYSGIVERIDSLTIDDEYQNNSDKRSTMRLESFIFVFEGRNAFKINLNRPDGVSAPEQLPIKVISYMAVAVYCGSVFVTGIGKNRDEIWRFDARNSNWNKCASLRKGRYCHSMAFVDHILYICGGWGFNSYVFDDVEAYDAIDDTCSVVGKLTYAVYDAGNCVPYKSSLYIFGGLNAHYEAVNSVLVYNTKFNTCTILTYTMPIYSAYLRAALFKNYVILLGEETCFLYNFDSETWDIKDQIKTDVEYFGMTVHNENLFVIGGRDSNGKIPRDDVRYVPIVNILNDEQIKWKDHAKLPQPLTVYAFGKLDILVKQI